MRLALREDVYKRQLIYLARTGIYSDILRFGVAGIHTAEGRYSQSAVALDFGDHRDLHSVPTRRSSDLETAAGFGFNLLLCQIEMCVFIGHLVVDAFIHRCV